MNWRDRDLQMEAHMEMMGLRRRIKEQAHDIAVLRAMVTKLRSQNDQLREKLEKAETPVHEFEDALRPFLNEIIQKTDGNDLRDAFLPKGD
jgi:predicted RNase H-like nuclease (RuvC/YqgF family)